MGMIASVAFRASADFYVDINTNNTSQVLVHFDTDPGHTYILQYKTNLANTNWSNLYTGYNYPFVNHYIIPDKHTNKARLYRLKITTP